MPLTPEQEQELIQLRQETGVGLSPELEQERLELRKEVHGEPGFLENIANVGIAGLQGATFGVGPKVMSAVAAPMAKVGLEGVEAISGGAYEAPPLGDVYRGIYGDVSGKISSAREQMPQATLAAETVGALGSGYGAGGVAARFLPKMGTSLASKAARLFGSALGGEASYRAYKAGTAQPGTELEELTTGAPVGAIAGAAAPAISAAAKPFMPAIEEGLKASVNLAKKYDIPVALSQVTPSKALENIQKISQELPFSEWGKFKDKQVGAFQRALTRTFGQDSDKITTQVMDKAFKDVGKDFDTLASGKTFPVGGRIDTARNEILEDASAYSGDAIKAFNKEIRNIKKSVKDGNIKGEELNFLRARMNRLARKTADPEKADLFRDAENLVVDLMTEGDDVAKGVLSEVKQKYKNLLVVEPLAAKAKKGQIQPSLLTNRVNKIYGRSAVRGQAGAMGELAQIAREVLPELGGSDTAQKMLYTGGSILGLLEPTAAGFTATALSANTAYQAWLNQNQAIIRKTLEDQFKRAMSNPKVAASLGATAAAIEEQVEE